jgi:Kef-type K+ transport system membrane component KefB
MTTLPDSFFSSFLSAVSHPLINSRHAVTLGLGGRRILNIFIIYPPNGVMIRNILPISVVLLLLCHDTGAFSSTIQKGFQLRVHSVSAPITISQIVNRSTRTLLPPSNTALSVYPPLESIIDCHHAFSSLPNLALADATESAALSLEALGKDIFIFLIASVVVVPLFKILKISPVLGFLAVGCAIGPFGLGLFSNTEADLQLGDFGILFLLFNEGLSLSPQRIKDLSRFSGLGVLQLLFSTALFFGGTLFAGPMILKYVEQIGIPLDDTLLRPILSSPVQAFCIAAAGALSSSAFVLPILKQKKWEDRPEGIAGLSILLLQDLAVAPLLVIIPVLAGAGPQTSAELGLLVAKATLGFGAVLIAGSYVLRYIFDFVAAARSTETFVAAALLVAIGMGQAADFLGLSSSTGAFAAGVLLAGNRYRAQIQADIKPFEGILLGIFFMTAGANLDLAVVICEWPTLFTGIAAFIVTKAAIIFAEGPALGLTVPQAARVALTLAGGGEFAFVLFKLAQDLGVLPPTLAKLLTASVIISMSLTPLLGELGEFAGNYLEQNMDVVPEEGSLTATEANALFDEIDSDRSGAIELDELRNVLIKRGVSYVSIAEVFTSFDTDGDGTISREEWKAGLDAGLLQAINPNNNSSSSSDPNTNGSSSSDISFQSDAVVICGYGEIGRALYTMLQSSDNIIGAGSLVVFDLNPTRVASGVLQGAPIIYGDGARMSLLQATGVVAPRAVIITYANENRRVDATMRLRASLPDGTPIYAMAGNSFIGRELLDAGATEVISETTETVLRFTSLLGICSEPSERARLRELSLLPPAAAMPFNEEWEPITGFSEYALLDLASEVKCTRRDLADLYAEFSSVAGGGNANVVPIAVLKEMIMRSAGDGPSDGKALDRCMKLQDSDGRGELTFDEFVRATWAKNNGPTASAAVPSTSTTTANQRSSWSK